MANFIIKNKINNINDLKDFNIDGYKFDSFDKKLGNIFLLKTRNGCKKKYCCSNSMP